MSTEEPNRHLAVNILLAKLAEKIAEDQGITLNPYHRPLLDGGKTVQGDHELTIYVINYPDPVRVTITHDEFINNPNGLGVEFKLREAILKLKN